MSRRAKKDSFTVYFGYGFLSLTTSESISRTNDTAVSHGRESIISFINSEHPSSSHLEFPPDALMSNPARHRCEVWTLTSETQAPATPFE